MAGRAAGGCVLVALGSGALAAAFAASPTVGVLTLWTAGGIALWQAARKINNPSPPPPDPPPTETNPQFTSVPDPDNPHRTLIVWQHKETPS